MNWYEAIVPVGHTATQTGQHLYACVYVQAETMKGAKDKIKTIPAVGGNKTPKHIEQMEKPPPDERVTNPWGGYSEKFMNILNREVIT